MHLILDLSCTLLKTWGCVLSALFLAWLLRDMRAGPRVEVNIQGNRVLSLCLQLLQRADSAISRKLGLPRGSEFLRYGSIALMGSWVCGSG